MGEIILRNAVERQKGFLYYVDGQGNVCRAKMHKGGKVKSSKNEESPMYACKDCGRIIKHQGFCLNCNIKRKED
jgi:hypothetical protein